MTELNTQQRELIERAIQAARKAYAPESGFQVGAAVLTASGKIYTGCNVENASYGISMCAERVAVYCAVEAGERSFEAMAVVAGEGDLDAPPCGACRQALFEFSPEMVVTYRYGGRFTTRIVAELLPDAFDRKAGGDG
ncbi:MAG: cytidine deaminase [Thermoleophilia bacterium]